MTGSFCIIILLVHPFSNMTDERVCTNWAVLKDTRAKIPGIIFVYAESCSGQQN